MKHEIRQLLIPLKTAWSTGPGCLFEIRVQHNIITGRREIAQIPLGQGFLHEWTPSRYAEGRRPFHQIQMQSRKTLCQGVSVFKYTPTWLWVNTWNPEGPCSYYTSTSQEQTMVNPGPSHDPEPTLHPPNRRIRAPATRITRITLLTSAAA